MPAKSHQVLIGVFVGAVLTIGAGPIGGAKQGGPGLAQLTSFDRGSTVAAAIFTLGRDAVLDVALDAYGEVAARLKQI